MNKENYFRIRINKETRSKYEDLKLINNNMIMLMDSLIKQEHYKNYQKIAQAKRKIKVKINNEKK